jgi:hypothetical protein
MDEDKRPEDRLPSDNKEEQGPLSKANAYAPLVSAVIQLVELILRLLGLIR